MGFICPDGDSDSAVTSTCTPYVVAGSARDLLLIPFCCVEAVGMLHAATGQLGFPMVPGFARPY